MKKTFLYLVFICISINCKCQDRHIVVRIDTLDLFDKYEDLFKFNLLVTNQGFANIGEGFDSADNRYGNFPKYFNTIILRSDSSHLRIPLDNSGSYVEITGLYESEIDTLKIDKYLLYSNCNFDTVKIWTTYFKDDTLEVDRKKSSFKIVTRKLNCKRQPPDTMELKINNTLYRSPVNFGAEQLEMHVSGNGSRRTIFGKEKNRFYVKEIHKYGINTLLIRLSQ